METFQRDKVKRQWTNWENLLVTHMTNKMLFLICRKYLQINKKMRNVSGKFKKGDTSEVI